MLGTVILLLLLNIVSSATISGKDFGFLPPLFQYDNYEHCMLDQKALFCAFTFKLKPLYEERENTTWDIIKNVNADPRNYRHDFLRHGICVPTKCPTIKDMEQKLSLRQKIEICYNEKYAHLELKGNISDMLCYSSENEYRFDTYDVITGMLFIVYIIFLIFASMYEGIARNKEKVVYDKIFSTNVGKIISAFSIPKNWHRLRSTSSNPDARKLRSIQGMRFYNMVCVILCHTIIASFAGPVENTKYIENVTNEGLNMFIANGQYAVQTFFVISGWLLSLHFFQMLDERKNISSKHLFLALINRYIRLTPTLAVVLAFECTWLVHMGKGPQWDALVVQEYKNCRTNWWTNILYINNYIGKKSMCLHQTWYLAADTQLFILSLVILKIASKIRRDRIILLFGTVVVVGLLIQGSIAFIYDYDIVVRQYPEMLYNMNVFKLDSWHDLYSSGQSNIVGYTIGLTAGYLFYKYRNIQLQIKKIHVFLWWILTFGLCIFIVLIAGIMYEPNYKYTRVESAMYWAFGKNLFALGIAIGIFGFSQKIGWFARWFCEWKAVQIFGRLTYSTYIIHVTLIRIRAGLLRYPLYINDYLMVNTTLGDIVLSYLVGTLLCLAFEMPVSALQKLMLPQSSKKKVDASSEKSLKTIDYDESNTGNNGDKICTKI